MPKNLAALKKIQIMKHIIMAYVGSVQSSVWIDEDVHIIEVWINKG